MTPSFNQRQLLENTISSVVSRDYPDMEYIIIDGGSVDGSIDVIKKLSRKLTYWVSEPDNGRGALNKGFQPSSGEIMAWLEPREAHLP